MNELAGLIVGFVLTLFVFSYLLGDNPLFRLAIHLLVGVSAAFAAVIAVRQVFVPIFSQIRSPSPESTTLFWLVPVLLGLLLVLKRLPAVAWLGNGSIAVIVGVGAAVALTGAITGTLLPQVTATYGESGAALQGLIIALLTICTLLTFQFTHLRADESGRLPAWRRGIVLVGRTVLMITFGAVFAGLLNTSLLLLVDRIDLFVREISRILS